MKLMNVWVFVGVLLFISCQSKSGQKTNQADSLKTQTDSIDNKLDAIPDFAKRLRKDSTLYAAILNGLPVYVSANGQSTVVGKINFTSAVTILEVTPLTNPLLSITDYWCRINNKNKTGWVLGQYLTKEKLTLHDFNEDIIGQWMFTNKDTISDQVFSTDGTGYVILSDGTFDQNMPEGIKGQWSQASQAGSAYTLAIDFDTDMESQDGGPSTHVKFKQKMKVLKTHFTYIESIVSQHDKQTNYVCKENLIKTSDTRLHRAIINNNVQEVYLFLANVPENYILPAVDDIFKLVFTTANPNYEILGTLLKLPGASLHICRALGELYNSDSSNPVIQSSIEKLHLQSQTSSDGGSYLMQAIRLKMDWFSARLMDKGVNVNAQDTTGNTALHYAITFENSDIAMKLLDKNADVSLSNKKQMTPGDLCAEHLSMQDVGARISKMTKK